MNSQRAFLSNESNYTVFRVGDKVIRFRAPYSLEHYTEVKEWNHGSVCQKTSTLPYRKCRGEYCSPANLAQQRSFWKASHKANGHGRAMLAPTMRFFDSLHGYIVAMAKYKQNDRPEEEYIDLIPILKNLYFDPETFLATIKEVRVANG